MHFTSRAKCIIRLLRSEAVLPPHPQNRLNWNAVTYIFRYLHLLTRQTSFPEQRDAEPELDQTLTKQYNCNSFLSFVSKPAKEINNKPPPPQKKSSKYRWILLKLHITTWPSGHNPKEQCLPVSPVRIKEKSIPHYPSEFQNHNKNLDNYALMKDTKLCGSWQKPESKHRGDSPSSERSPADVLRDHCVGIQSPWSE